MDSNIKKITNNTPRHTRREKERSHSMPTAVDHITATGKPCTINFPAHYTAHKSHMHNISISLCF